MLDRPIQGHCLDTIVQEVGPYESLVQWEAVCWMGPCELIAQILWCRKWAYARILYNRFQATVGQFELISDIRSFIPWANASIFLRSTPAAGPCESLIQQPVVC